MLHLIASTGRTATSFLAQAMDELEGVAACHEGHRGNDQGQDLLPLINLQNFAAFKSADTAAAVAADKRNAQIVADACATAGAEAIVDAAYYNAVMGSAILTELPTSRMVGIIRDCAGFVRSVTWLHGEDPMPVGWPAPDKPLSTRERFIAMGRVRPVDGPDAAAWGEWGPIERNIWLWRETNHRLLDARDTHPDRTTIVDFDRFRADPAQFLADLVAAFELDTRPTDGRTWDDVVATAAARENARVGGYQVDTPDTWTDRQRHMLEQATNDIEARLDHARH